jgi:hypothetical protein
MTGLGQKVPLNETAQKRCLGRLGVARQRVVSDAELAEVDDRSRGQNPAAHI